jgi:DNA-binding transcriptional MocR family regulator
MGSSLGTFSKTLAPGFRVGWALAPHAIREKLVLANEAAVLSPSSFTQSVISEYLATADWKGQINTFRGVYHERKKALIGALEEYLPELRWTNPNGGFYVWVTLPDQSTPASSPRGHRAWHTPGTIFAEGRAQNMRLSFCYPTPEHIRSASASRDRHPRRARPARHLRGPFVRVPHRLPFGSLLPDASDPPRQLEQKTPDHEAHPRHRGSPAASPTNARCHRSAPAGRCALGPVTTSR